MTTRTCIASLLAAAATSTALAELGERNSIVYAARFAGASQWQFTDQINIYNPHFTPVGLEIGVFMIRAQGTGIDASVYKTYIDMPLTNTVTIFEDTSNGVPASGRDGRAGQFNYGPQTQRIYTNRNASIPGTGFRISSALDTTDGTAAGGISVHQLGPADPLTNELNPYFDTSDPAFVYRFDIVANPIAGQTFQSIHVHTPISRIKYFAVYDINSAYGVSDLTGETFSDPIDLNITWVPAPSATTFLVIASALLARRRR